MRPTIFSAAAIIFLPLVAHSQTAAPAANLQAKLTPPATLGVAAAAAAPAAAKSEAHSTDDNLTVVAPSYTFSGGYGMSTEPVLVHVVSMGVEAAQMPIKEEQIAIRLTVDRAGVPTNLQLAHATGTELDRKALEAVSQYRFKPATANHLPTQADVTVQVKLDKQ